MAEMCVSELEEDVFGFTALTIHNVPHAAPVAAAEVVETNPNLEDNPDEKGKTAAPSYQRWRHE